MFLISSDEQKTAEMIKFENETGKKAIWMGKITETFKKWQRGEKIYETDQERIGILVPLGTKNEWQNFAEDKGFSTISKLIREAVNNYIEDNPVDLSSKDLSEFSQKLKQALTPIKGNSEFLIRFFSDKLNSKVLTKIKEIFDSSILLENELNKLMKGTETSSKPVDEIKESRARLYDVLIIEDDLPTISLLSDFFEMKGYSSKGVKSAKDGLEELKKFIPKLILLDIILPDIEGYDVCREIRTDIRLKNVPIWYITARPEEEVSRNLKETGANNYLTKPFDLQRIEQLADLLGNK